MGQFPVFWAPLLFLLHYFYHLPFTNFLAESWVRNMGIVIGKGNPGPVKKGNRESRYLPYTNVANFPSETVSCTINGRNDDV
mmetsp:Transcript_8263/g.12347  ORF Transcript_8263/g.12347 Transcript_8263/m.12347 type:complete len:82 (+) Transcript_8263:210-455(+)